MTSIRRHYPRRLAALTLIFAIWSATPLYAATTFDLTGFSVGATSPSVTTDGITLTFGNASPSSSGFFADSDGLAVLGGAGNVHPLTSFTFTFDTDVVLKSYTVGYIQDLDGNETMTFSAPLGASVEDAPFSLGTRNFDQALTILSGQTVNVAVSGADDTDLIQFQSLTIDRATVPLPSAAWAGLLLLAGMGVRRGWRRRRTSAA